jgi:hypothetical protein
MLTVLPVTDVPDFTALLVVNTPMNDGMPDDGGGGLVPPDVDHAPPHAAGGCSSEPGHPARTPSGARCHPKDIHLRPRAVPPGHAPPAPARVADHETPRAGTRTRLPWRSPRGQVERVAGKRRGDRDRPSRLFTASVQLATLWRSSVATLSAEREVHRAGDRHRPSSFSDADSVTLPPLRIRSDRCNGWVPL